MKEMTIYLVPLPFETNLNVEREYIVPSKIYEENNKLFSALSKSTRLYGRDNKITETKPINFGVTFYMNIMDVIYIFSLAGIELKIEEAPKEMLEHFEDD